MLSRPCKECAKKFVPKTNNDALLCSRACIGNHLSKKFAGKKFSPETSFRKGGIAWNKGLSGYNAGSRSNMWKGGQVEKTCAICTTAYKVDLYRKESSKTCSRECMKEYRKTEVFRSALSETQRAKVPPERIFVKTFTSLLRTCSRYALWREKVLKRDDYTCQSCAKRGGKLHVDHIKPFMVILLENKILSHEDALLCKELWDTENGQTLCLQCHYKTPTFGSKALNSINRLTN